jgi:hypothetical protein
MKKRLLAFALVLALLLSFAPAAFAAPSTDYAARLVGTTGKIGSSSLQGINFELQIKGTMFAAEQTANINIKFDTTKLKLVLYSSGKDLSNYNSGTLGTTAYAKAAPATVAQYGSAQTEDEELKGKDIYILTDDATHTCYLSIQPKYNMDITTFTDYSSVMKFALAFVGDNSFDTLTNTSIQLCTAAEVGKPGLGQNAVAIMVGSGFSDSYQYAVSNIGTELKELAEPEIIVNSTNVKDLPGQQLTLTGLAITGGDDSINVPEKGGSNNVSKKPTVTGTYDDGSTAEVTDGTWTLCKDAAGATPLNDSDISIDASTGVITVKPCAKAYTAVYAVCTKGSVKASKAVEIKRATAEAKTITLSKTTLDFTIPSSGSDSKSVTATVTDQYGEAFSGTVTWGNPSQTLSGVTFNNGTVTVNAGAAKGTFTVTANCDNATPATLTVKVSEVPKDDITVSGPATKEYDGTVNFGEQELATNVTDVKAVVTGLKLSGTDTSVGENKTVDTSGVTYKLMKGSDDVTSKYNTPTYDIKGKVTAKEITITAADITATKEYDGDPTITVTGTPSSGVVGGDVVTFSGTGTFTAGADVGNNKAVTVTVALDGADKNNYKLSSTTVTATGTITAKSAAVTRKTGDVSVGLSAWTLSDLLDTDVSANAATVLGTEKGNDSTGVVVKFYKASDYEEVEVADLTAGDYFVDIEVPATTYGNYKIDNAMTATYNADAVDPATPVDGLVKVTLTQAASTGGYTGGGTTTTTPAPQEEAPTVIDSFIKGYDNGNVGPNDPLTRAETAVIMARLSKGFDKDATYYGSAPDVKLSEETEWYYTHVNYDIQKGIINGYPDGNFYPNEKITRAEFAAMLARFMGLDTTGTASFDDVNTEEFAWASGYVAALEKIGVVNGYEGSNDFKPGAPISRAEAIKMVVIALDIDVEGIATNSSNTTIVVPPDLSTNHWAYKFIMAALSTDIKDIAR